MGCFKTKQQELSIKIKIFLPFVYESYRLLTTVHFLECLMNICAPIKSKNNFMRYFFILSIMAFFVNNISAQNVAVNNNGSTAATSAMLDVSSNTKGLLIPRMSKAERDYIILPATSLLIFQTDNTAGYYYNAGTALAPSWLMLTTGGNSFTLPYAGTNAAAEVFKITNSGTGTAMLAASTGGTALAASTQGDGAAITASTDKGFGLRSIINDTGIAVFGLSQRGNAGKFEISYSNNPSPAVHVKNGGKGDGLYISNTSTLNSGSGLYVKTTGSGRAAKIDIVNPLSSYTALEVNTNGTGSGVYATTTSGNAVTGYSNDGTGVYGISGSGTGVLALSGSGLALEVNGKIKIAGAGTFVGDGKVLTSDASGNATWQKKEERVAFRTRAITSAYNSFPDNTFKKVEFNIEEYDLGNDFIATPGSSSSATSVFTVPVSGIYHLGAQVRPDFNLLFNITSTIIKLMVNRNGSIAVLAEHFNDGEDTRTDDVAISTDLHLLTGDKVWVEYMQSNTSFTSSALISSGASNYFSAHILFAD